MLSFKGAERSPWSTPGSAPAYVLVIRGYIFSPILNVSLPCKQKGICYFMAYLSLEMVVSGGEKDLMFKEMLVLMSVSNVIC